jgi:hypothetical protein
MADQKNPNGEGLKKGALQVASFGGTAVLSEIGGQIVADNTTPNPDATPEGLAAREGAIKAGVSGGVAGLGALALASKKARKYAGAVIGGALLNMALNLIPVAKWGAKKIGGMFKKNPAEGTKGRPRGAGNVRRHGNSAVVDPNAELMELLD